MTLPTVQQVAANTTRFAAHLRALSGAQVFATPQEAAAALRDTWLTGHSPTGTTLLDPYSHPETTERWDQPRRDLLVALTWPNPYALPVTEERLRVRDPDRVREGVAALLHRLRAQYPDPDLDLLAAADQHPLLDGPTVRRLFDAEQPLDATTLLDMAEHLHLGVGDAGWTASPGRLRADLARYAQVASIAAAIPVHEYDPLRIHQAMGDHAIPPEPTSKYRALFEHLDSLDGAPAPMTFRDVNALLRKPRPRRSDAAGGRPGRPEGDGLTLTARHEAWWHVTTPAGARTHQRAWTAAGYRATRLRILHPDGGGFLRSRVLFVPFDEIKWSLWGPLRHELRTGALAVPFG